MRTGFQRLAITAIAVLALALPVFGGQLDDYYLAAFHQQPGSTLEKAVLLQSTDASEPAHSGTPLKHGLSRDWNQLEPATQKVLAKQLALPTLSGTPTYVSSSGGHFTVHYTTSGTDAPNVAAINQYTGLGLTSAADWARKVADAFEFAYAFYQNLGYHMPPTNPYDVYLASTASIAEYGETVDIQKVPSSGFPSASSSYIQIDKDFTNSIFKPQTYTPLQSLQITSAHEFHHAIQYGYNYYFDIWYAEATSTWFESEVYSSIKQNYTYIAAWFQNSSKQLDLAVDSSATSTGAGYGRWIFDRYLAESHTNTVVRSVWEKLAGIAPTNGQDIPMIPVLDSVLATTYNSTLSADFFGFAKRVYTRNWSTTATVSTSDIGLIPSYVPVGGYSSYPVNSSSLTVPSVTLPHYSFAYYKFSPSSSTATLTITVTKASGIQAAVFKKVGGTISEIPVNTSGSSYTVNGFSSLGSADEVALLIANTTGSDNLQANFSTDGSTSPISTAPTSSSSGGSGCFIATAAYGSYLHPKVQALRDLRDHCLLTNAPGRAFVTLYYRFSPPLADFIARHDTVRLVVRLLLTPLVCVAAYPASSVLILVLGITGIVTTACRRRTMTARLDTL